ncbi:Thiol:disulfide interchange protein DsbD [Arenibacter antarcticus]|uniref:Thioredoxin family protein n=1 Tax=Arenibacter antarcticus TaxID=2040469 RepID=A0ABW5VES6_9FLAO|nr:thioredoxin family protein [Arenibacter sp. H213]MCM4168154.1 protein-disulfide isomerase [Arenibacter sp. H213]
MKYFIYLFLLPIFLSAQDNNTTIAQKWYTNYEDAQNAAQKSNSEILMYFTGSDWCAPCKVLKKNVLDTQHFTDITKNYVLLYVDLPRKKEKISAEEMQQNKELLAQWNKKGLFPFMKIISPDGKGLSSISGYMGQGDMERYMNFLRQDR